MSERRSPAQIRAERTVETILDVALELYVREGVIETTTNAIAEEARMSIGTIYQYFANKEEIAQAVSDRCFSELEQIYLDVLSDDDREAGHLIDDFVDSLVDYVHDQPGLVALLTEGGRAFNNRIGDLVTWTEKPVAQLIHTRRADIEFDDALRSARVMGAAVHGALLAELRHPNMTPEQLKRELSDLLWGYVETRYPGTSQWRPRSSTLDG